MLKLESYVNELENIIKEVLLPKYNIELIKSGRKPLDIKNLVTNYRSKPIAALLQPKGS